MRPETRTHARTHTTRASERASAAQADEALLALPCLCRPSARSPRSGRRRRRRRRREAVGVRRVCEGATKRAWSTAGDRACGTASDDRLKVLSNGGGLARFRLHKADASVLFVTLGRRHSLVTHQGDRHIGGARCTSGSEGRALGATGIMALRVKRYEGQGSRGAQGCSCFLRTQLSSFEG